MTDSFRGGANGKNGPSLMMCGMRWSLQMESLKMEMEMMELTMSDLEGDSTRVWNPPPSRKTR